MREAATEPGRASRTAPARPRTIAVDGSAASGKSTIGRRLADFLGYRFLDTGVMYRAVTLAALERGIAADDGAALTELARSIDIRVTTESPEQGPGSRVFTDGRDVTNELRAREVEDNVSLVSRVAGVREALVRKQRGIADGDSIVMAGRDIGTVVLPDADLKIYLDATLGERARRRHREFATTGHAADEDAVLSDLKRRDQIDTERDVSPLRAADDAVVIQTDGLTIDGVFQQVLQVIGVEE
jgi:cytidylate kinase